MGDLKNYLEANYNHKQTQPREENQIGNLLRKVFDRMAQNSAEGERQCLHTGFLNLDEILGGMEPGELIVLNRESTAGITGFLLRVALHVAQQTDRPVFYFTSQQPASQLARRMLSITSQVRLSDLERSQLTEKQWEALYLASKVLSQKDIRIYEEHISVENVNRICQGNGEPALLILDEPNYPYEQAETFFTELKELAAKMNAVVLCVGWCCDYEICNKAKVDKALRIRMERHDYSFHTQASDVFCEVERNVNGRRADICLLWDERTASFFFDIDEKTACLYRRAQEG